jgi:hypothetical protein
MRSAWSLGATGTTTPSTWACSERTSSRSAAFSA